MDPIYADSFHLGHKLNRTICFSRPLPEIRWYQNGVPINNSGDFFLHQNFDRTLRLGSLNPGIHDGFYACEAVSNNRSITATFQVKVLGAYFAFVSLLIQLSLVYLCIY